MSRAAATRKFRKDFDATSYIELVDATFIPEGRGMCKLRDGRMVTFYPGKSGKVVVFAQSHKDLDASSTRSRTFGVKELDAIREWVLSGGSIEAEEQAKRIRAHAFELFAALQTLLASDDGFGKPLEEDCEAARVVLAKIAGAEK